MINNTFSDIMNTMDNTNNTNNTNKTNKTNKKKCIMFGNCQCGALYKFLSLFSNFTDLYETEIYANWQLIDSGDSIPTQKLQEADLVIYQPLSNIHGCYSTNSTNAKSFFKLLKPVCKLISFPRIHNNALFPIYKRYTPNRHLEFYGKESVIGYTGKESLVKDYIENKIDFNFKERMENNYNISKEKESNCDIKIIDFIFQNIQNYKLFLTQDHPTSIVFNKLAQMVCDILFISYEYEQGLKLPENFANLPDNIHNTVEKQYPISRYSIAYFKFNYVSDEDSGADEFYKNNLLECLNHL